MESPRGHELVHQGNEAGVVSGFQQVPHFVYDDVFEALPRFAGEIGIEPDAGGGAAAASPFRLHSPDKVAFHTDTHERLPFGDYRAGARGCREV
jgi:hypothetical protein